MVYSPSNTEERSEIRCDTPSTAKRTPARGIKRKRLTDDGETQKQFLEIAQKQADALKVIITIM